MQNENQTDFNHWTYHLIDQKNGSYNGYFNVQTALKKVTGNASEKNQKKEIVKNTIRILWVDDDLKTVEQAKEFCQQFLQVEDQSLACYVSVFFTESFKAIGENLINNSSYDYSAHQN